MEISVEFQFCSAHRLPFYNGPCNRLHGHNYRLQVLLHGRPSPKDGMVRDFDEVRRRAWELAIAKLDHQNLNDILENPTAENIVVWLWEQLRPHFEGLKELRLWETPEYCVTYRDE
jgi:6-pyruvoyltetrahydropterin/6-carboxytetrahydropterin synthase